MKTQQIIKSAQAIKARSSCKCFLCEFIYIFSSSPNCAPNKFSVLKHSLSEKAAQPQLLFEKN